MILVDSSVWIDFFNETKTPQSHYLDQILGKELIILGDIILLEVLQGIQSDKEYHTVQKSFEDFPVETMLDKESTISCAEKYRYLRRQGITPRKTIDIIIGTFCINNDLYLLHSDRDFLPLVKYLGLKSVLPL